MPRYNDIPPCRKMFEAVTRLHKRINQIVQRPLLYTNAVLEGRSTVIRARESNLGNMIADIVRAFYQSDIALINSGGIRCDRVIPASNSVPLRIRDVIDVCPFDSALVVKRMSGQVLATSLENSVSDAHTDGRFMQLSGLSMSVTWHLAEGHRVANILHHPRDGKKPHALERHHIYTVAMSSFIASGFDGYSCFENTKTLVDAEGAMTDTNLLLEVFGGTSAPTDQGSHHVVDDRTTQSLGRARRDVVKGYHKVDGLPIIDPRLENRIEVAGAVHL
jgi:2',3'-cyclic-nucleotide 2'-phosphodiesterase (5'-nucleotidase family)